MIIEITPDELHEFRDALRRLGGMGIVVVNENGVQGLVPQVFDRPSLFAAFRTCKKKVL